MTTATVASRRGIPRGIWILGFVSMLMDISSEMVMTLLPLYLVLHLGTGVGTVGLLEGIAVATAMTVRLFSGILADWTGNRKLLTVIGYGLGALSRPFFPLAGSATWVIAARIVDRVGKGIRAAPRDAMVADLAPPYLLGASFGLRKSLDTVGGFVGPLIAMAVLYATTNNFKTVFWLAAIPAFLSIGLLVFGVHEPERRRAEQKPSFRLREAGRLTAGVWSAIGIASILTFARFSEAFLILRAQGAGIGVAWAPSVIVVLNLVQGLTAYPAGVLSDKLGRRRMLFAGLMCLMAADLVLAGTVSIATVVVGVVFWGLHMGFTQGTLTTMIADTAPAHLRGAAFGAFSLVSGIAGLAGNAVAGLLWDAYSPSITFYASAIASLVAIVGMMFLRPKAAQTTP